MAILKIKDKNGTWQVVRDPAYGDIEISKEQIADLHEAIKNVSVDLTGYATEDYVDRHVEEAILGGAW